MIAKRPLLNSCRSLGLPPLMIVLNNLLCRALLSTGTSHIDAAVSFELPSTSMFTKRSVSGRNSGSAMNLCNACLYAFPKQSPVLLTSTLFCRWASQTHLPHSGTRAVPYTKSQSAEEGAAGEDGRPKTPTDEGGEMKRR